MGKQNWQFKSTLHPNELQKYITTVKYVSISSFNMYRYYRCVQIIRHIIYFAYFSFPMQNYNGNTFASNTN